MSILDPDPPKLRDSPRSELVQSPGDRHGATLERSLDLCGQSARSNRPIPQRKPQKNALDWLER